MHSAQNEAPHSATPTTSIRVNANQRRLYQFAWVSFGLAVVTLPWRLVLWRWERPSPPIYADFTDILLRPHDIFLFLTLLFWGFCLWRQRTRPATGPLFLWAPLLGLTLMAWVSVFAAVDRPLALVHAFRLTLMLGVYLFALDVGKRPFRFARIIALQLMVQAFIGLGQFSTQRDLGLQWLGERQLAPDHSEFVWAEGGLRALRAYGLTDHPNILAIGLALGIVILFAFSTTRRRSGHGFMLLALGMGTAVLLTTFSRPVWIATAISITFIVFACKRIWRQKFSEGRAQMNVSGWFMLFGILVVFWSVLPYLRIGSTPELIAARIGERQFRQAQQAAINVAVNELFTQHAITGTGIGTLPIALQQTYPDFPNDYQPASINIINVAAEIGLPGALFYGLLLVTPWFILLLRRRRLVWSQQAALFIGISGVLVVITLLNFTDAYTWFYPAGRFWQWLVWGLWGAVYQQK